jgi:hypothetical protein
MKKNIFIIILFSLLTTISFAQDEATETPVKEKDLPVFGTFESGSLIDAQTVLIPDVKTLEMVMQHKFGTVGNGSSDLWGIYGASNIRIGLNYVPVKKVQIGAGVIKKYVTTDFNAKWTIIEQTRKNTIPVSVALYGNVAIDGRNASAFQSGYIREGYSGSKLHYRFEDRLSYFSQLIVARKFCDYFSLQAGVSFSHYNAVNLDVDHDRVAVHLNGRFKVSPQGSIIFNYDQPLSIKDLSDQILSTENPKETISIGYEVSTGTHAFQVYMGSNGSLLPQESITYNKNAFDKDGISIGFVITRLWAF